MSLIRNNAVPGSGNLRTNMLAGVTGWVAGLSTELNYGLIAFAPLLLIPGKHGWHGIAAALLSAVFANLGAVLFGGRPAVGTGGRPMLSIVLAAYVGALTAFPGMTMDGGFPLLMLASLCLMLSGAFQAVFGVLKLGRIITYVPYPVFSGFSLAAAITLLTSAGKTLFGAVIAQPAMAAEGALPHSHGWVVLVGVLTIVIGRTSRHWLPRVPSIVVAFLGGVVLDSLLRPWLGDALGPTLPGFDSIPLQIPLLGMNAGSNAISWATVSEVLRLTVTTAFSLAMLASLETLLINSSADNLLGVKANGDRQLFAQGMANVMGGAFAGVPCAPSISRSALVIRNGGRTYAVQLTYIALSILILAFPQPLRWVPQSVLGASMILVAIGLIDTEMVRTMRQAVLERTALSPVVRRQATENALVLISVAVVGTLLGLIQAVIIGTVISTVLFLQHNRREVVRRVIRCHAHRSRRVRDQAGSRVLEQQGGRIAIVEAQGPLYFASADRLFARMEALAKECQWLVVDCRRVTHLDTTAVHLLAQHVRHLEQHGVTLHLSYVSPLSEMGETLHNLQLHHTLPASHWHVDTDQALEACENELILRYAPPAAHSGSLHLLETDLCRDVAEPDAEEILRACMHRHSLPAGELLFRRGDRGDSLYVVTAGDITLEMEKGDEGKSMLRLATYTPGVIFGEMAFLQGGERSADARAETSVELYELRRDDMAILELQAPHLASQLLINVGRVLAERLRNCTRDLAELEVV